MSSIARQDERQILSLTQSVAALTGAVALAAVALVILAGRAARRSRALLIRIYGPAVSWARVAVVPFAVLQALLLVGLAAFLELVVLGRIYAVLVAPVAIAAALWVMHRSGFAYAVENIPLYAARTAHATPDSPLGEFIERIARTVDVSAPRMVVVGLERDFCITERANHLVAKPRGRTLYLSLPLCRILRKAELAAVIGRELAGFKGLSGQFVQTVLPRESEIGERVNMLQAFARDNRWAWLTTMPDAAVLAFVRQAFSDAVRAATRQRELDADQTVASTGGAQSLAAALLKQHMFAPAWTDVLKETKRAVDEDGPAPDLNLSARFAALARERATPDAFREAGERLLDSHDRDAEHPPCAVRLARLNISPDDVRASVLTVAPDDAAIDLIEGHEALEMELCRDYQVDMFLELAEIGEMLNGLFEQSGRQGMKRH